MENSRTKSISKKQKLLSSLYKLQKISNQSNRYYSNRNSPRCSFNAASPNILFPIVCDSDPASPSNIYIHPQDILNSQNSNIEKNSRRNLQSRQNNLTDRNLASQTNNRKGAYDQIDNITECSRALNDKNTYRLKMTHKKSTKHLLNNTRSQFNLHNLSKNFPINSQDISSPSMNSNILNNFIAEQKYEKQQSYSSLVHKIEKLTRQNDDYASQIKDLTKKLKKCQYQIKQFSSAIAPYTNNVTLMQQKLEVISKDFAKNKQKSHRNQDKGKQRQIQNYSKSCLNYQLQLLKITQQRQFQQNQQKINRFNLTISQLHTALQKSHEVNAELGRKIQCLNSIIEDGAYLKQMRQLYMMSCEQLNQYKIEYHNIKNCNNKLQIVVNKLKNKVHLLTSLIGYGVVTSVQNNDLFDLENFRESLSIKDGFQEMQTYDTFGMLTIKKNKSVMKLIEQQIAQPFTPSPCLYLPNFLIFYDSQQLKNTMQDNTTIVIKPEFFLMVRAIFDSKYNEYVMYGKDNTKFPDHVFGFIDFFRLKGKEKRVQINTSTNSMRGLYNQQNNDQIAKSSFFIKIFDKKIGSLLEVTTFKQFLLRNIPEDEIFYFLMCRNILNKGPQLSNYINCSDAYTFICYNYAHQVILQLVENYDKQSKAMIINHLNSKKVLKNKKLLIKTPYVLRLLLQVYRKFKQKKTVQLKFIFNETLRFTQKQFIEFTYFFQLLHKNFGFLTRNQICQYYRKTVGVFHMSEDKNFFQCFNASCIGDIFLKQCLIKDQNLKNIFLYKDSNKSLNYLLQLVSDSVYQIGSEKLYKQFISLAKLKQIGCQDHVKITMMFSKMMLAKLSNLSQNYDKQQRKGMQNYESNDINSIRQHITRVFEQFNNTLIDIFNRNLKRRERYEQKMEGASSKIGRFIRSKVQQFYSQFIEDINKQISQSKKS